MYKVFFGNRYLLLTAEADLSAVAADCKAIHKYSNVNELRQFVSRFAARADADNGCVYFHDLETLWQKFRNLFRCIDAAGGVVTSSNGRILVINRLGVPDLPKGKAEPGEDAPTNALREVAEETGLANLTITRHLTDTYHTYPIADTTALKRTQWFAMHTDGEPQPTPQTEENITTARWMGKSALPEIIEKTYASLRAVFEMIE